MSISTEQFLTNMAGLREAAQLEQISGGVAHIVTPRSIAILRRGMIIAGFVALESFVRDRTAELLVKMADWPARFSDLPDAFRDAALLNALPNIEKYAKMIRREKGDYELEVTKQIEAMAGVKGPKFTYTRFLAGDHTGNISDDTLNNILKAFQIKNCWADFRLFASDVGFGIPSVQEALIDVTRKRHRSAHSSTFVPTAADVIELPRSVFCAGICFDVAMTASIELALSEWKTWTASQADWRSALVIYLSDQSSGKLRVRRVGSARALRICDTLVEARQCLPKPARGKTGVMVERDASGQPVSWIMF